MPTLFAIGGGEIADAETRPMDEAVVDATGVDEPEVLFLPTASADAVGYVEKFTEYYGEDLGCSTSVARLSRAREAPVAELIEAADAVYVGGGDTGYMLDTWRTRGVDDLLRTAWQDGTVMAGLSAGALCWFEGGISDAVWLEDVPLGPVHGLGIVRDLHATVHADPDRRETFREYCSVRDATGIALEDLAAIEVRDEEWRIHTASPNAFAFHVREDAVVPLPTDGEYRPLAALR